MVRLGWCCLLPLAAAVELSDAEPALSLLQHKAESRHRLSSRSAVVATVDAAVEQAESQETLDGTDIDNLRRLAALLKEKGALDSFGDVSGVGKEKLTVTSSIVVHPKDVENNTELAAVAGATGATVGVPSEKIIWTRTIVNPEEAGSPEPTSHMAQELPDSSDGNDGDEADHVLSAEVLKKLEQVARSAVESSKNGDVPLGSHALSEESMKQLQQLAEEAVEKKRTSERKQKEIYQRSDVVRAAEEKAQDLAMKAQDALDHAKEAETAKKALEEEEERRLAQEAEQRAKEAEQAKLAAEKAFTAELRAREVEKEKEAEELAEEAEQTAQEAEKMKQAADEARVAAEKAAEDARQEALDAKDQADRAKDAVLDSRSNFAGARRKELQASASPTAFSRSLTFNTDWAEAQSTANLSVISEADMDRRVTKLLFDTETIRDAFSALSGQQRKLPPMAFIKTHRTGSSTVTSILHRLADERNLTFVLPAGDKHSNALGWPEPFPGLDALNFNGAPMHQFDMICNNAVYSHSRMKEYLKPQPLFFTILRSPLAQVSSAFDYFRPPCGEDWNDRIKWLTQISSTKGNVQDKNKISKAQFRNSQAFDLGWYEHTGNSLESDDDNTEISDWLEKLDSSLGFVLLNEYFNEGFALLRRKLGLDVSDLRYIRMKRGAAAREEPDEEQADSLMALNHVDVKLYEHFNKTFWKHWDAAGGWPALGAEVRELRARNEVLERACAEDEKDSCPFEVHADSVDYTELFRKRQVKMIATGELKFESMTLG